MSISAVAFLAAFASPSSTAQFVGLIVECEAEHEATKQRSRREANADATNQRGQRDNNEKAS